MSDSSNGATVIIDVESQKAFVVRADEPVIALARGVRNAAGRLDDECLAAELRARAIHRAVVHGASGASGIYLRAQLPRTHDALMRRMVESGGVHNITTTVVA